jgi:hypothetical protein
MWSTMCFPKVSTENVTLRYKIHETNFTFTGYDPERLTENLLLWINLNLITLLTVVKSLAPIYNYGRRKSFGNIF